MQLYTALYRDFDRDYVYCKAGFFKVESFDEFHESIAICENFIL